LSDDKKVLPEDFAELDLEIKNSPLDKTKINHLIVYYQLTTFTLLTF
tara:strand:+ start:166 stop:306 length:141 start_codon:yes stop_codon:yes gene_type:complete